MNDNVKKIFEILGVEPDEKFIIITKKKFSEVLHIDTKLRVLTNTPNIVAEALRCLLTGEWQIVKLPKDVKKKKLRDLTVEDFKKWKHKMCKKYDGCKGCPFFVTMCNSNYDKNWLNHKDLYSDKFLDQEVEVPE